MERSAMMDIYKKLVSALGTQGWWPVLNPASDDMKNPAMQYHPGDYSYPKTEGQTFEICIGAILAQNTSWNNAEKALENLGRRNLLFPKSFSEASMYELKRCIKPAGYYNQKAKKLKVFSEFFIGLGCRIPERVELLALWGIGKETADSILLYAYKQPFFVIDAYTKRIMSRMGFRENSYDSLQNLFHGSVEKDYKIYNEFHALLVELAKRHCKKVPDCRACPLAKVCRKVSD